MHDRASFFGVGKCFEGGVYVVSTSRRVDKEGVGRCGKTKDGEEGTL